MAKKKAQNSALDKEWQVGDSAAGVSGDEIKRIRGMSEDARSGAQQSILDDADGMYAERGNHPSRSAGEVDHNSDDAEGLRSLTDEEAGYDQAAFDEEVDSAMDDDEIAASEAKAWKLINDIEDNVPIEKWNDLQKAQVEEMTGFTYDELLDAGVTKPDGMSIEQLLENSDE